MKELFLFNIPNFYCSYYLYGLNTSFKIKYVFDKKFEEYNFKPFLIFSIDNKTVIIDNDDPRRVKTELYDICNLYFCTNKLVNNQSYNQNKVRPLYPHYPINILRLYTKLFKLNLFRNFQPCVLAKEIYVLARRPTYKNKKINSKLSRYIYFSCSNWKKEEEANLIRAAYINECKSHPKIKFEGGFIPRKDRSANGVHKSLENKKYSPRKFSKLIAKSLICFNNPAVKGAVSWRLAEHLNNGSYILSLPFKIELPRPLTDKIHMHYIQDTLEIRSALDNAIEDDDYRNEIAANGKKFFAKYCTPEAQANYIGESLLNSVDVYKAK